jgi:hypothetical protein
MQTSIRETTYSVGSHYVSKRRKIYIQGSTNYTSISLIIYAENKGNIKRSLSQLLKRTLVFVCHVVFQLCYDGTECLERKYRQTHLQYI